MINFLLGLPSLDLLPVDRVQRASQLALSESNAAQTLLQYNGFIGDKVFLSNLSKFLTREYCDQVDIKNLCATPGASLMIQHILTLLTRPQSVTRFAFFQNPTYLFVYEIFKDCGYSVDQFVSIPEDSDGLDVDHLETFLKENFGDGGDGNHENSDIYSAVVYCVPTHANPSSTIMSGERREKLVKLAKHYNVLVICDDVYDLLTYEGTAPKRLVAYDFESESDKPAVISNCSFSKILAPGLRTGWIEARESIIKRLGLSGSFHSGSNPSNYASGIVSQMLCSHDPEVSLRSNIERVKTILHERLLEGLWKPFQELLVPLGCTATLPKGGYFLWVRLPAGVNCTRVDEAVSKHKLEIVLGNGNLFATPRAAPSDEFSDYVRLCFAHHPVKDLQSGMKLLQKAIRIAQEKH
ncbi:pyridoxal phosphate-dependent transferase [Fennellomyces sp. T-0311]|nr:pyridoxal phosphate-dependent transferase [Fennellomyces sp. T-0311]